ncbi:FAD-dependent monooxygenase [Humibacter sp. RRB41]|uniref:FAD-dependent monooxygenase n=1 Tax=Humibacter sp. RRB41 TaxID=2919946 RepID=UPI001FA99A3D|nr:FAD-dependent monooxygenase [Humibacter sp. RRB41]
MSDQRWPSGVWDVAIVGAGPIGLLLASELAGGGIRVVVFEQAPSPSPVPKANGIVGDAAVSLSRRGLLDGTGLRVVSPPRFQFGPLVLDLGVGPGNPLHVLPIPQRRLEELLEAHATGLGVQVLRSHEVLTFSQSSDDIAVAVRTTDGEVTTVRARYLVGCDGAHSIVRKQAGIDFPGITSDEIARIARVMIPAGRIAPVSDGFEIPGIGHVAAMRPNRMPGGRFTIAPVAMLDRDAPDDLYLISTHEPRGVFEASDAVSIDELRSSATRVLGAELPFTDATAIRSTIGNSRLADAYRHGRVFLAGDAAHIFNAGGSALNAGVHDALDLAHRLIATLRGGASDVELDGYEVTRRAAGRRVLAHTRAQAELSRDENEEIRSVMAQLLDDRRTARRLARVIEAG